MIYLSFMVFCKLVGSLGHEKHTASLICPASLTKMLCGLISPTFLFMKEKSRAVLTKVYNKYHIYSSERCLSKEILF